MMNFVHVHVGNPARAGGPKGMNFAVQMMNFAVQMMTFKYKTDATARRWRFCCSESDQAGLTVAVCVRELAEAYGPSVNEIKKYKKYKQQ